jgi:hypothetical protein
MHVKRRASLREAWSLTEMTFFCLKYGIILRITVQVYGMAGPGHFFNSSSI